MWGYIQTGERCCYRQLVINLSLVSSVRLSWSKRDIYISEVDFSKKSAIPSNIFLFIDLPAHIHTTLRRDFTSGCSWVAGEENPLWTLLCEETGIKNSQVRLKFQRDGLWLTGLVKHPSTAAGVKRTNAWIRKRAPEPQLEGEKHLALNRWVKHLHLT